MTIRGIPYLFLENCLSRFTTTGFGSGNFRRDGIEQQITYALFLSIPVDCLLILFTYCLYVSGDKVKKKVMKVKTHSGLLD